MGNRKENLKKSLGISEYPWSSDEDDTPTSQPAPVPRRQSDEPRPSVADTPGTSSGNGGNNGNGGNSGNSANSGSSANSANTSTQGAQQSQSAPASVRRQAKMDRALFWSIISSSSRPPVGVTRICDVPVSYVARAESPPAETRPEGRAEGRSEANEPRRHERTPADIQRLLAFKRLTRNLNNRNRANSNNVLQMNQRRFVTSVGTRSSLFSPDLAIAAAARAAAVASVASVTRANRGTSCCSRSQSSRLSQSGQTRNANPPDVLPAGEGQASTSSRYRTTRASASAAISASTSLLPSDLLVNVDQSDEDIEAVPDAPPAQAPTVVNNAEGGNAEAPTHNSSAGVISLEEEIVEIDAVDEPDNPLPAGVETDATRARINTEGNAVATNSDENTESSQQQSPFLGVKRKRDTSDENAEPYSVQEFNQSLLRLLECPVCLEWMEPPISQCRRGHLVCSRCRTRLASCPVCRTTFSSVRNRAMEGVAEMLRYPCRHGCGREVRLRRRAPHEASCGARRYHCPAPPCARHPPLAHHEIAHHFQCKHLPILKIGRKHKFSMKVNSEQHDTWLIMALDEYFHLRVDVDIRTWGVIVYVAYIGPKRKAKHFTYEVTVEGQHNARSLKYARATHSDLESSSLNVSRQDCFHLTLDQALNFLRFKNRHCEPDKFLDFDVEIDKCPTTNAHESKDESDS